MIDLETLWDNVRKTGYEQAKVDILRAIINPLIFFECDAKCRACLREVGDRIAKLGESTEGD